MPTFEIQHPNGQTFEVEGADQAGAFSAFQKFTSQSTDQPNTALDVAKQIPSGLVAGTEMLATGPAQVLGWLGRQVEKIPGLEPSPLEAQNRQKLQELIRGAGGGPSGGISQFLPQPETTAGQFARTASEFVPSAAVLPGNAALNAGVGAISGLASEAAGQATQGTAAEPYARFGAAAATPFGLSAARRAITPLPMNAARTPAVQTLQAEGVPLSAGAVTGSRPLQWFEQALGDIPGAGRRASASAERTSEGFTRAILRRAGEDAPRATPDVINNAFERIGNDFDRLEYRNVFRPDQQFNREARAAIDDYRNVVAPPNRAPIIENFTNEIANHLQHYNGVIPGDVFQSISSRIGRTARAARGNPEIADALNDIRDALHGAMERGLARIGSPDLGAWQQARNQYRNMLTIERAATGPGENAALGLISPSALRNATVAMGRRAYARGQGDFADIARAGEAVLRPLPQSGTAPRSYAMNLPTHAAGLAGALFGGIPGAAAGYAAALAGPPITGRFLHSRPAQAYLRNQLLAAPANLRRRIIQSGILGGASQGIFPGNSAPEGQLSLTRDGYPYYAMAQ